MRRVGNLCCYTRKERAGRNLQSDLHSDLHPDLHPDTRILSSHSSWYNLLAVRLPLRRQLRTLTRATSAAPQTSSLCFANSSSILPASSPRPSWRYRSARP